MVKEGLSESNANARHRCRIATATHTLTSYIVCGTRPWSSRANARAENVPGGDRFFAKAYGANSAYPGTVVQLKVRPAMSATTSGT
jgi:hypothetical protein